MRFCTDESVGLILDPRQEGVAMTLRYVKLVSAGALSTVAFTICSSQAQAFFPPVIPNNNVIVTPPNPNPILPVVPVVPPPPVVVVPVVPPNPIRPLPPPVICPKPTPRPQPHCPPPSPVRPCEVPEPATVVSGLMGLAAIGMAAWRRRGKSQPTDTPTSPDQPS
jgi:hypothetical protein